MCILFCCMPCAFFTWECCMNLYLVYTGLKKTQKNSWAAKVQRSMVGLEERTESQLDGEKIITDWMSLLKWHVCVCSVLLCISVRSAAASHLGNPASQSIRQPRPCCPSLSFSLCLYEPPLLAPACYIKPFHLAEFSKLLCMLAFRCH